MRYIIKRNLLIYFRDKGSVFFSLLAVFIIFGLYILFLGDMMVAGMKDLPGARFLMDSWIMGGLLNVVPITTSLGAMGTIIDDKKSGIYKDFAVSPLKKNTFVLCYLLSGILISFMLSLLTFILAQIYIFVYGGQFLSLISVIKVLAMIIFTNISSSIMMLYLVSWFKSTNAYAAASTVFGTLIGFLTGIYIPIGSLPKPVQIAIKIFPPSHGAVIFRRIMMEQAEKITFDGLPESIMEGFRLNMGLAFKVGNSVLSLPFNLLYLFIFMFIFSVLTITKFSRKGDIS